MNDMVVTCTNLTEAESMHMLEDAFLNCKKMDKNWQELLSETKASSRHHSPHILPFITHRNHKDGATYRTGFSIKLFSYTQYNSTHGNL